MNIEINILRAYEIRESKVRAADKCKLLLRVSCAFRNIVIGDQPSSRYSFFFFYICHCIQFQEQKERPKLKRASSLFVLYEGAKNLQIVGFAFSQKL